MDKNYEQNIKDLIKKGVLIDDYGLIKPDIKNSETIQKKIYPELVSLKKEIDRLRLEGKHILYMPGSYDLIHAGHAYFIYRAMSWYLSIPKNSSVKRSDLVVLILADDDSMIANIKASKWIGNGGNEEFKRPIQSSSITCPTPNNENWRLFELASIPEVDLVAFIPSPKNGEYLSKKEILETQSTKENLDNFLREFLNSREISPRDTEKLKNTVEKFEDLVKTFSENYEGIVKDFEGPKKIWSVQGWQLFLHSFLGFGNFQTPFIRIVSTNDISYKDQVDFLMSASGLKIKYIEDETILSTTKLLETNSCEELIEAKKKNY